MRTLSAVGTLLATGYVAQRLAVSSSPPRSAISASVSSSTRRDRDAAVAPAAFIMWSVTMAETASTSAAASSSLVTAASRRRREPSGWPGAYGSVDSSVPSISTSAPPSACSVNGVHEVRIATGLVPLASMVSSPVHDPVRRTSLSTWSTAPRSGSSKSRVRASESTSLSNGEPKRSSAVGLA